MRKKIHNIPKPKFKIGEICVLKNSKLITIIIIERRFRSSQHGDAHWIYIIDSYPEPGYLDIFSTNEENLEKLSDEQKVELL